MLRNHILVLLIFCLLSCSITSWADDGSGLTDTDGDGLILVSVGFEEKTEPINGVSELNGSYRGKMLIVLDPSRVILGVDEFYQGENALTLEEFADQYDAVAAVTGGSMKADQSNAASTAFISEGELFDLEYSVEGFVGLDEDNVLQVGFSTVPELVDRRIRDGVGCGPVLIENGEMADDAVLSSGLNPRAAIGQREDGAILFLVIEGRQVNSLGATYKDVAKEMQRFGAVTACALLSGSRSALWFNGNYITDTPSVEYYPVPTCFLVLKPE